MNHLTQLDDLQVECISDSLSGVEVDLVITGSIAATESVKFIRSLRRLGAGVNVWVTKAALQFTTVTSLEWASGRPVWIKFLGIKSHIGQADVCIVAPCSASFASRINLGLIDTPCAALVSSYLGQNKPVILVPTMHESLQKSPYIAKNIESLREKVIVLEPDYLESKLKFPNSSLLADRVSFEINQRRNFAKQNSGIWLAYGGASESLDPVRKITNISSGKLGSELSDHFQRKGLAVRSFRGTSEYKRGDDTRETRFSTNEDLLNQLKVCLSDSTTPNPNLVILAAALSDYESDSITSNKISSDENSSINLTLKRKAKVIQELRRSFDGKLVAFKLLDIQSKKNHSWIKVAEDYILKYRLDGIYVNFHEELSSGTRKGFFVDEQLHQVEIENTKSLGNYLIKKFFK